MPLGSQIRTYLRRLVRLGVSDSLEARAAKRLALSNTMALSIMGLATTAFLVCASLGIWIMAIAGILGFTGYAAVLVLAGLGLTRASRVFHIAYTNLFVLCLSWYFGKESGFYFNFLSPVLVAMLIFGREERKSLIFGIGFTVACLSALGVLSLLGVGPHPLSPREADVVFFINLVFAVTINSYRVFVFYRTTAEAERELATAVLAARAADGAKSRFLANMSHEIRTPLSGILGISELLLRADMKGDQKESVESIRSSANDLLGILNGILDVSKIEAGKLTLEAIPFELRKLVESVRRFFSPLASRKNLRFDVEIDSAAADRLTGDPVRLKQVLNNLLGNAFKFTEQGGVTLRVMPEKTAALGRALLAFEVEDTGIGIPPEARPRLFEAFAQDPRTAVKFGGTGLGLHISRQIVEMMSGRIDFRSEPGRGSCFRFAAEFALDLREPAPEAAPMESSADRPGSDLRVLIVEDHPVNQKVLEGLLSLHGLKADRASDGVQALDACARKEYDLVLMDSHMPVMDGYECTRRLREKSGLQGRPVIIGVTADAMAGSRERCLEAGMNEMITKPVMEKDLMRVIERWVGNRGEKVAEPPHWTPAGGNGSASAPPATEDWVDPAQMEEMKAWILQYKPGFWEKACAQFEESYHRQTSAIREACKAGRFHEAGDAAHAFKGVCLMLGFRRMGEICNGLEAMGLGGDPTRWRDLLSELEAAHEPSLRAWSRWVGR